MTETPLDALTRAEHDNDDQCNANYYLPLEDCDLAEWDRRHAAKVLDALRVAGWMLIRRPEGMEPLLGEQP